MAVHELDARPEHLFQGYFDAATPAVLHVASGDEVALACLPAGTAESLPPDGAGVREDHRAALAALAADKGPGSHIMTGPVHVEGAEPGDALRIDILEIRPIQTWGWTGVLPLRGALPEEFTDYERMHVRIDPEAGTCTLPWGLSLPLEPFFGILAVAPPAPWGRVGSNEPRAFGGNLDNKELVAGTTLHLPVFERGALFSAGDGHGRQGDGEVCIAALETALAGRFRLSVEKGAELAAPIVAPIVAPWAETPEHLISMGFHESLDEAMRRAVREMVAMIVARTGLSRNRAYMLASLAADLRITQVVDGEKGVHMMIRREWLRPAES